MSTDKPIETSGDFADAFSALDKLLDEGAHECVQGIRSGGGQSHKQMLSALAIASEIAKRKREKHNNQTEDSRNKGG